MKLKKKKYLEREHKQHILANTETSGGEKKNLIHKWLLNKRFH